MRISDWSSDVCSSDLRSVKPAGLPSTFSPIAMTGNRISVASMLTIGLSGDWPTSGTPGKVISTPQTSHLAVSSKYLTRSEEHTSELQSLMRISYAVFCLKKKKQITRQLVIKNLTIRTNPTLSTKRQEY